MISGALPARFRGLLKKKMADSQVKKAIVWLAALKKRKRLSQLRDETRSSLAPLLHALKRRHWACWGKAKTGLYGLPMWFLGLRRIIKAFKLQVCSYKRISRKSTKSPELSPSWSFMSAEILGTRIPPHSARGPLFRRDETTSWGGLGPPKFFGTRTEKIAFTRQKSSVLCPIFLARVPKFRSARRTQNECRVNAPINSSKNTIFNQSACVISYDCFFTTR